MPFLKRILPHSEIPNIRFYYALSFLSEFYFIVGNWIFFWLKFMKYGELGLLDMFAFLFGFLMEVPAGAIADSIGRKKTINVAFFFTFTGFITIATSTGNVQLVFGFFLAQLGWAFYSGAAEALAYDTLKEHKQEKSFDRVISTAQSLGLTALVIGALVGGFVYSYWFRLPHLLTGTAFGIGFLVSLFLHEPSIDSEHFSMEKYVNQIKRGFQQLGLPSIKPFIPLIFVTVGVAFMYGSGILQPAIAQSLGYNGTSISILGAIGLAISAIVVRLIPWMRTHLSDRQGLQLLACFYIAGFILVTLPIGIIGGGFILVTLAVIRPLTGSWTSVVVNRELPSQYRATTLSAIEMIKKLPYILVAAVTGSLIDSGHLKALCLVFSAIIALVVTINFVLTKKPDRSSR